MTTPTELARELAARARGVRSIALEQLEQESDSCEFGAMHSAFKDALVHDQTEADFADAFAQTLTYSLLTARWVLSVRDGRFDDRYVRTKMMKEISFESRFLGDMFTAISSTKSDVSNRLNKLVDELTDFLDRVDVSTMPVSELQSAWATINAYAEELSGTTRDAAHASRSRAQAYSAWRRTGERCD